MRSFICLYTFGRINAVHELGVTFILMIVRFSSRAVFIWKVFILEGFFGSLSIRGFSRIVCVAAIKGIRARPVIGRLGSFGGIGSCLTRGLWSRRFIEQFTKPFLIRSFGCIRLWCFIRRILSKFYRYWK